MNELGRQLIHVVFGLAMVAYGVLYGKQSLALLLLLAVGVGLLVIQLKLMKVRLPFIDWVLANFERADADYPGKGALHYFVGALLLITLARDFSFSLAAIAILALADGVATIVGLSYHRPTRLHWHPSKTWEGTMAFFGSGVIAAYFFIGVLPALLYSLALALIESVDFDVDDNLLIPVSALALNYLALLI